LIFGEDGCAELDEAPNDCHHSFLSEVSAHLELRLDFMWSRRRMCFVEIASWPLSWLIRVWRAVAVPDIASAQAMEQQQRPDDGVVFMTVFVSALSGIAYVEVYVPWYVQCAK
jgi:hypothetical protein